MMTESLIDISDLHYLVIDDEILMANLVKNMLHSIGATKMDIADNGEVALGRINEAGKMPDIIICDLNMPELDGVAFLRHLAERKYKGGVIMISGSDTRMLKMVVDLGAARRLNVLGSLMKPFKKTDLQNMISSFKELKEKSFSQKEFTVTPEELRLAIDSNQLVPFFQPKIDIKTGKVSGVEALARWQHPERGFVPPVMFIPVAEEHNLIGLLTQDILFKTFRQAARWRKGGLNLPFAVNLSALLLSDVNLPDQIEDELGRAGIDPSNLTLEITETGLCNNMTSALDILLRLRLKGIKLSIDDFGTGNSTLEQLHNMPFSELKIDRLFVRGAAKDDESSAFFRSAMMLAKSLKLVTVAEGVETQEDLDICAKLECDVAQGYFFSRPVPGETFLKAA